MTKWMLVGPSAIYERHRAMVVKELTLIDQLGRNEQDAPEIVTWNYAGTNLVIVEEARKLELPVKVFDGVEGIGRLNAMSLPNSHLTLRQSNAMQAAIDYCDRGIVFLNARSVTSLDAFFRLYVARDDEKLIGSKLWKFVPIDGRSAFFDASGKLVRDKRIGLTEEEKRYEVEDESNG